MAHKLNTRGPRGTGKLRKYFNSERKIASIDELNKLELPELESVLEYLITQGDVEIVYGLRNCFPNSPIYSHREEVPLHTSINDYYINEDCIIPLYKYVK